MTTSKNFYFWILHKVRTQHASFDFRGLKFQWKYVLHRAGWYKIFMWNRWDWDSIAIESCSQILWLDFVRTFKKIYPSFFYFKWQLTAFSKNSFFLIFDFKSCTSVRIFTMSKLFHIFEDWCRDSLTKTKFSTKKNIFF